MGLLQTLQDKTLEARKEGSEHSAFLVMLVAEAARIAKDDGNRPITDEDIGRVIATNLKQFKSLLEGDGKTPPLPADAPYAAQVAAKRDLLKTMVPDPPTGEALAREIREAADGNDIPIEMKSMKAILAILNEKWGGQIDGRQVAEAIKNGV